MELPANIQLNATTVFLQPKIVIEEPINRTINSLDIKKIRTNTINFLQDKNENAQIDPALSYIANFKQEPLPVYHKHHVEKLRTLFDVEFKKYIYNEKETNLKLVFDSVCAPIAELNFEEASVELTPDNTIKFTLLFSGQRILMVTKPILPSELELNDNQIIFSFFINRKLVLSNMMETSEFIASFKKYLSL